MSQRWELVLALRGRLRGVPRRCVSCRARVRRRRLVQRSRFCSMVRGATPGANYAIPTHRVLVDHDAPFQQLQINHSCHARRRETERSFFTFRRPQENEGTPHWICTSIVHEVQSPKSVFPLMRSSLSGFEFNCRSGRIKMLTKLEIRPSPAPSAGVTAGSTR
eukprot:2032183-Pleurochrysis_carterae.AAC.2